MAASLFAMIILGVLLFVGVFAAVAAYRTTNGPRQLVRSERLELESNRELIDRLKELCYENRDNNLVADIVIQEIKDHESANRRKGIGR